MRLVLLKTERSERISSSTSIHRMRFPHSPLGKVNIRRHSQAVRPRSAKPLFPGSNPGDASNKKRTFVYQDKGSFFELSVPLTRNVKYPSDVKRTTCVKCAFGTICGTLNFTLRPRRNTSLFRKA